MQRREYLLAAGGIVASTSIGAVAFTSASAERDVAIEISSDDNAIIGLSPGTTNAVTLEDDVLEIDTSTETADGLNPDGTFMYGDADDPTTVYAFSITNNDPDERTFTLALNDFTLGGTSELTLPVYETDETLSGDLTPSNDLEVTLSATDTVYVLMDVNTDGLADGDTMNGTLSIDVE